jgi:ribosomal protein S18 acetylase RimI-like enzyme
LTIGTVEVRPLKNDEVEELLGLWKEFMNDPSAIDELIPTHQENVKRQREFVVELMGEDSGQVLVASDGSELIGYVMFQNEVRPPLELAHRTGYVMDLYVKPSHRRRGVGERLLRSCLDRVKSKGVTHVQLRVWNANETAIALYRKLGFRDRMMTMQLISAVP